ncbi:hypothetical protein L1987_02411 [Smallanthus sonchifolius]|uniref:Uncharacterized protein n=1 Tax=Smallanthus sonchifolius TaxID=185202 RepID=A0ACB9K7X5_9ASTR|nr:hypothetical protein L1987_02411 [Smallanthus sonchifolius]
MAKLAPFVFTLTVILAFSEVFAYRTTITTTIIEDNGHGSLLDSLDNPRTSQAQCPKITGETNCHAHILRDVHSLTPNQGVQQSLEMCCTDLKKVTKQCQCDTIHQTYDKALKKVNGELYKRVVLTAAQTLPKACKLEVTDCQIKGPNVN